MAYMDAGCIYIVWVFAFQYHPPFVNCNKHTQLIIHSVICVCVHIHLIVEDDSLLACTLQCVLLVGQDDAAVIPSLLFAIEPELYKTHTLSHTHIHTHSHTYTHTHNSLSSLSHVLYTDTYPHPLRS